MAWYTKYLSIYGKPFSQVPQQVVSEVRQQLAARQSPEPTVSVVVIAYNEECRLAACLWSLSHLESDYPMEIIGVNNNSADQTEQVFQTLGLPYYNESRQSPGFARQCGLAHARGKYHFFIDADTCYPAQYVNLMMKKLLTPGTSCVGTLWSFYPDERHSAVGLWWFELIRDTFLWLQHFKRPELCIRGMTFAFRADYARQVRLRTDIRRGEDGSLALELKKFGKITFLYNRKARPVTGYGTLNEGSLLESLWHRIKVQGKGITRIFYKTEHYEDQEENLVKRQ
jgi:glycosyltransferase involved in cell wall biosynthesis